MNLQIPAIKLVHDIIKIHSKYRKVNIYILHKDLTNEHFDEMEKFLNNNKLTNYDIYVKTLLKNELSSYTTASYITDITNYRYYIWSLNLENEKIIYLDIDVQLQKELFKFYDLKFDEDIASIIDYKRTVYNKFISFSTGTMVISLKDKKHNENILKQLLFFHENNKNNPNADQWCFNNVFRYKCYYLEDYFEYDLSTKILLEKKVINFDNSDEIIKKYENIDDFYIIHYNGAIKPYNYGVLQKIKYKELKIDRYKLIK